MEFKKVSRLATLLSKSFSEDFMRLMVTYKDISSSEAASRLNLHIKTAQDFLEELTDLGLAGKKEVYERKRPYFRYYLKQSKINLEVDFAALADPLKEKTLLSGKIREKKNTGTLFAASANHPFISAVTVFSGEGRGRKERRINLTTSQGRFLYYLPFPNASFQTIREIIKKAGIDEAYLAEIVDIVNLLKDFKVIEFSR